MIEVFYKRQPAARVPFFKWRDGNQYLLFLKQVLASETGVLTGYKALLVVEKHAGQTFIEIHLRKKLFLILLERHPHIEVIDDREQDL